MLNQVKLQELFQYRSVGHLVWRQTNRKGKIFGCKTTAGYIHGKVQGKTYLAHRLIFLLHQGFLPKYLDHKDRNKSHNRIENLRPASLMENGQNSEWKNTKTGYRGVAKCFWGVTYQARIKIKGIQTYLGTFKTARQAALAYNTAAKKYHGEFAVLNSINRGDRK